MLKGESVGLPRVGMISLRLKWNAIRSFVREIRRKRTAMPAASVTLPIRCPRCDQPVALFYDEQDESLTQRWTCPYGSCRAVHSLELRGWIVKVAARHEPPTA